MTSTISLTFTTCDCGRRLRVSHVPHHKRYKCPNNVNREGHCAYCLQPHAAAMLEKLRAGMVPEEVAAVLGHKVEYVLEVRGRARKNGCLAPGPKHGSEAWKAERAARARYVMGERTCVQCLNPFIPQLGCSGQETCSNECARKRKNRKRAAAPRPPPKPVAPPPPPVDKEELAMRPRDEALAAIAREADSVRLITGEASHALWFKVLDVKARVA